MKVFLRLVMLSTLVFLCSVSSMQAQCYENTRSRGVAEMNKKNYDKAIQLLKLAKECDDVPSNNDLDRLIKQCKANKEKLKPRPNPVPTPTPSDPISDQYIDSLLVEAETHEAELAKRAYMNIVGMKFFIEDGGDGKLVSIGDDLYAKDILFLNPIVCYAGLADGMRKTTLYCKVIKPNGKMVSFPVSPDNYSFAQEVVVAPGRGKEARLGRWGSSKGNAFFAGTYTFEIYSSEGILLRTEELTLM